MRLLDRPISTSDQIPYRFCVISMEFLLLSRRRSSSRNVPYGRPNVSKFAKLKFVVAKFKFVVAKLKFVVTILNSLSLNFISLSLNFISLSLT